MHMIYVGAGVKARAYETRHSIKVRRAVTRP